MRPTVALADGPVRLAPRADSSNGVRSTPRGAALRDEPARHHALGRARQRLRSRCTDLAHPFHAEARTRLRAGARERTAAAAVLGRSRHETLRATADLDRGCRRTEKHWRGRWPLDQGNRVWTVRSGVGVVEGEAMLARDWIELERSAGGVVERMDEAIEEIISSHICVRRRIRLYCRRDPGCGGSRTEAPRETRRRPQGGADRDGARCIRARGAGGARARWPPPSWAPHPPPRRAAHSERPDRGRDLHSGERGMVRIAVPPRARRTKSEPPPRSTFTRRKAAEPGSLA